MKPVVHNIIPFSKQTRSFRDRFGAGKLRRRAAKIERRKAAGHAYVFYDPKAFSLVKAKKVRRPKLSFRDLRDKLYARLVKP